MAWVQVPLCSLTFAGLLGGLADWDGCGKFCWRGFWGVGDENLTPVRQHEMPRGTCDVGLLNLCYAIRVLAQSCELTTKELCQAYLHEK